jgi:tetratricopeptide (TPR) repeat protein
MKFLRKSLLVVISLLAARSLSPQATIFTIYGQVRLPNGTAASRVAVKLTGQSGLERQTFSDDMGRYEFADLPRGRYHVIALNPAASDQFTDPVEADTARASSSRILAHIFLRVRHVGSVPKESRSPVVSVTEATQRVPKPAQKAFDHAIKLRTERKPAEALEDLDKAIDLYAGYFQALAERGHIRIALGRCDLAAPDFAGALALNQGYEPALRGSGICKLEQGKHAEAIADLEAAASLNPTVSSTYLFLGVANIAFDRREAARAALQKALALDSVGAARAHVHLANLYLKEERLKDAAAELDAYLAAVPNAPDAERLRAVRSQIDSRLAKP